MKEILNYAGCNYCVIDFAPNRVYEGTVEKLVEMNDDFFLIQLKDNEKPFLVYKSRASFTSV